MIRIFTLLAVVCLPALALRPGSENKGPQRRARDDGSPVKHEERVYKKTPQGELTLHFSLPGGLEALGQTPGHRLLLRRRMEKRQLLAVRRAERLLRLPRHGGRQRGLPHRIHPPYHAGQVRRGRQERRALAAAACRGTRHRSGQGGRIRRVRGRTHRGLHGADRCLRCGDRRQEHFRQTQRDGALQSRPEHR